MSEHLNTVCCVYSNFFVFTFYRHNVYLDFLKAGLVIFRVVSPGIDYS